MIHSMCGGKLSVGETVTLVKVVFFQDTKSESAFGWFLADGLKIKVGDVVVVPVGYLTEEAQVTEVVDCDSRVAPVSVRYAKCVLSVVKDEQD